jgi:RecA/RadA recombinase
MDNLAYLLGSCLASRAAHTVIAGALAPKSSETVRALLRAIDGYYTRDQAAVYVDPETLCAIIKAEAVRPEVAQAIIDQVKRLPTRDNLDTSPENVAHAVQAAQVREIRMRLAAALENGQPVDGFLEELRAAEAPQMNQDQTQVSLEDLKREVGDRTKLHPTPVNAVFAGGFAPGHAGVIFGRPGSGKTMVAVNFGCSYLRQGKVVLHIGNEESREALMMRYLSLLMCANATYRSLGRLDNLTNQKAEVRNQALEASMTFAARWSSNLHIVHGVYGFPGVRELVAKVKPDFVIVDQLRHIGRQGDAALHDSLEAGMMQLRAHAHEARYAAAAITQGGQSAEGKAVLDLGDIDGAKTGLQGATDWILGLGVNSELRSKSQRVISICRNKISGQIKAFVVQVEEQHTLICNPPDTGNSLPEAGE